MNEPTQEQEQEIEILNSLLRGEIAAVETYGQAIESVEDPMVRSVLETNQASHANRVQTLQLEVVRLGGTPDEESGVWGGLAKAVQGGANLFGRAATLASLVEGEEHGLADYRGEHPNLSSTSRSILRNELYPEQVKTHGSLQRLKELMS